jgi:hypothetical protein
MGNSRWILANLPTGASVITEIGAGDGRLSARMTRGGRTIHALDLAPPPGDLPSSVQWHQGNFFETLPHITSEVIVGCLILHHFDSDELAALGANFQNRKALLFVEPLRTRETLIAAACALPFVGEVTRHDMMASIRAGFLPGEISDALALGPEWNISETTGLAGSLRFKAWRD